MQELWDLYDSQRRPLHRQHPRGVPLEPGTYHLVIEALVLREDGRLLLTQRHPDKPYGLLWECTGGSALCGEDSLSAALRELQEETGLHFAPQQAHLLRSWQRVHSLVDSWLFLAPLDCTVRLQESEVVDYCWVDRQEMAQLYAAGQFLPTRPDPFATYGSIFSQLLASK